MSAKSMQVVNCTKCRFHCSENFSEEKRLQIFTQYYALADYSRQKDFLASHIVEASPKRLGSSTGPLKHCVARGYYLPIDGARKRVCGDFFCKTLDLNLSLCKVLMGEGKHVPNFFFFNQSGNSILCGSTLTVTFVWRAITVDKQPKDSTWIHHYQLLKCMSSLFFTIISSCN